MSISPHMTPARRDIFVLFRFGGFDFWLVMLIWLVMPIWLVVLILFFVKLGKKAEILLLLLIHLVLLRSTGPSTD